MSTLAQFRSKISAQLALTNTVAGDQGDIDAWTNEGVVRVLLDTHCNVWSASVQPGAVSDYALSTSSASGVLAIVDLYTTVSSQNSVLERMNVQEILELRRSGDTGSSPSRYYALAGHDRLLFFPALGAGDTITYYYVPRPSTLSASSDDPSSSNFGNVPVEMHYAIELWALNRGSSQDDDDSQRGQGVSYLQLYEAELRRIVGWIRRRGGGRAARAVLALRSRKLIRSDRSIYP